MKMANGNQNKADEMNNNKTELLQLNRAPKKCPQGDCDEIVFPSRLLSHFIGTHLMNMDLQIRSVFDSERSLLLINATNCPFNKNICLGGLVYGGYKGDPTTMPGKRFVCYPNFDLTQNYKSFAEQLPVLIMCARTSLSSLTSPKELTEISKDTKDHVYMIWCITSSNILKLYATITLYDTKYSQSRSCIRLIRDFASPTEVHEFWLSDTNYLLVTWKEIKKMTDPKNNSMLLEIILHENASVNRME